MAECRGGQSRQGGLPGYVVQGKLDALTIVRAVAVGRNLDEPVVLIHDGKALPRRVRALPCWPRVGPT